MSGALYPSPEAMRRRFLATLAAMALHVTILGAFFLGGASHTLLQVDRVEAGAAVTVSLARLPKMTESQETALEALRQRLSTSDGLAAPNSNPDRSDAAIMSLFESTAETSARKGAPSATGETAAQLVDPGGLASVLTPETADRNIVWPQVQRCRTPSPAGPGVILLVELQPETGAVSRLFVFHRGASASTQLDPAEQAAVKAVRACAPYRLPAAPQATRFEFFFEASDREMPNPGSRTSAR